MNELEEMARRRIHSLKQHYIPDMNSEQERYLTNFFMTSLYSEAVSDISRENSRNTTN